MASERALKRARHLTGARASVPSPLTPVAVSAPVKFEEVWSDRQMTFDLSGRAGFCQLVLLRG